MNRSWTFGKKIAAGFALSIVLMATIGVVAYRSINTLSNTSQMVTHTHHVLELLDDVFNVLQDAEIGMRGYVITGDENFLEPYQNAETKIVTVVNDLRTLIADNPAFDLYGNMFDMINLLGLKKFNISDFKLSANRVMSNSAPIKVLDTALANLKIMSESAKTEVVKHEKLLKEKEFA